jgi:hypothetical protein
VLAFDADPLATPSSSSPHPAAPRTSNARAMASGRVIVFRTLVLLYDRFCFAQGQRPLVRS